MKRPELYERVALTRDQDEFGLKRGDVAMFIDTVPDPQGGADGAILEVFNAVGDSIMVVTVPFDEIEALSENEVLAKRALNPPALAKASP
ncbi:MAG TPA: hypothetical protein VF175_19415 [Lacipirellula sp.]